MGIHEVRGLQDMMSGATLLLASLGGVCVGMAFWGNRMVESLSGTPGDGQRMRCLWYCCGERKALCPQAGIVCLAT